MRKNYWTGLINEIGKIYIKTTLGAYRSYNNQLMTKMITYSKFLGEF